jgi:hypothetical protein
MSHLGQHVVYRVKDEHRSETVKGSETLQGSVHHPEAAEFAGIVTRSHEDGSHDLAIFPPDRPVKHIARVTEGDGADQFELVKPGKSRKADPAPATQA